MARDRLWTGGILLLAGSAIIAVLLFEAGVLRPGRAEERAIFVTPAPGGERVTLQLIFPYRSPRAGLAHYLEHLVYLSAIKGKWGDVDPDTNAVTESSSIRYTLSGRPEELSEMLGVLAGVYKPLALSPQQAAEERGIVMREYDLDTADDLRERAIEASAPYLYEGSSWAVSVIGTPQEIGALSLAEAEELHRATHLPERAILFASGDITRDRLVSALAQAGLPPLARTAALTPEVFPTASSDARWYSFPDDAVVPGLIWDKVVALPQAVDFDQLTAIADLLADILESGLAGSLAKPLMYDGAAARSFAASVYPLDESHVEFFLRATPDSGVGFRSLQAALDAALVDTARGIPAETFARHHRRTLTGWEADGGFSTGGWMDDYMLRRLVRQREPKSMFALKAIDENITLAQVNDLAARMTGPGRLAITEIGTDEGP